MSVESRKRGRSQSADGVSGGAPAPCSSTTATATVAKPSSSFPMPADTTTTYHYPSTLPFPVVIDEDFPAEPYRSRNKDVKSTIHWGQRKLLLSEVQLLCMYCRPDVSYHIVYAGSAPGTHLAFLDDMFARRHTWELVDPGNFDRPVLEDRPNFSLRNEFFTNATAYGINARRLTEALPALGAVYKFVAVDSVLSAKTELHEKLQDLVGTHEVARGTEDIPSMYERPLSLPRGLELLCQVGMERSRPLLFVSDIRSGSLALPNFEEHVAENMRAQAAWTTILHGEQSMLKFRLPYTTKGKGFGDTREMVPSSLIRPDGTVPYLRGDLVLPIWTRPTSTEGRLVVPQGAFEKDYDVAKVENQFFFFNARVREQLHFNHLLEGDTELDHRFDAAAEVHCLLTYVRFMNAELRGDDVPQEKLREEVKRVSDSITKHLGITFDDAIRRRDFLLIKQSRAGTESAASTDSNNGSNHGKGRKPRHEAARGKAGQWERMTREMIRLAGEARSRGIWTANVDEEQHKQPSGFWVTTTMPQ